MKVYDQEEKRLDAARTYLKLAELWRERIAFAQEGEERARFLDEAQRSIEQALPIFRELAPTSYQETQHVRSTIEREIHLKDLEEAIVSCKALLKVYRQKDRPLDWARTHFKLAHLYRDRSTSAQQAEERASLLGKALQSLEHALPVFREHNAPASYYEAQGMHADVTAAREEALR